MRLTTLLEQLGDAVRPAPDATLPELMGDDPVVRGIALDSRVVGDDEIWAAVPGQRSHGADHASAAAGRRLAAVITDRAGVDKLATSLSVDIPRVVAEHPGRVAAEAAAILSGRPAETLRTVAVTGTNGKTTTTYLVAAALAALGERVGLIGTTGFSVAGVPLSGVRTTTVTTPESVDLQRILAAMVDADADAVAMEVSSHALALGRVEGVRFDVAGFTNLGVDHLDFHTDLEDYFAAKARLFEPGRCATAVVNVDDEHGRRLAAQVEVPVVAVGWAGGSADARTDRPELDIALLGVTPDGEAGSSVEVRIGDRRTRFALGLPGEHNVRNAVLALGLVHAAGLDAVAAAAGLADARVPGRMERVVLAPPPSGPTPVAVVDFAHTPQAVAAACAALRSSQAGSDGGRLIVVVGSGGDRDPSKRAPIGAAAAAGADVVVVTDDNPRTEDPAAIREAIAVAARGIGGAEVIDGGDRRSAIRRALELAGADGATVVVLGRGHETHQQAASGPVPFVDAEVIAEQWNRLLGDRLLGDRLLGDRPRGESR